MSLQLIEAKRRQRWAEKQKKNREFTIENVDIMGKCKWISPLKIHKINGLLFGERSGLEYGVCVSFAIPPKLIGFPADFP